MKKNNEEKIIKYLRGLILRCLMVAIIFLVLAILSKTNHTYKDIIVNNIYQKNISFAKIKKLYYKYLGGIEPLDKVVENFDYNDASLYYYCSIH